MKASCGFAKMPSASRAPWATRAIRTCFRDLIEHGPAQALGTRRSFEPLLKASASKRAAAYKNVRALIEAPETSRFVLDLQAMIARREWRAARGERARAERRRHRAPPSRAGARQARQARAQTRQEARRACAGAAARRAHRAEEPALRCRLLLAGLFGRGRGARKFSCAPSANCRMRWRHTTTP